MASLKNRRLEGVRTMGIETVLVPVSFQLNGTSNPTSVQGLQCSVARSDTGLHTVTLPAGFPTTMCVFADREVTGAKGGGQTAGIAIEPYGSPTSGTFGVRVMTMGTTTLIDPAASTTVRVNCLLVVAAAGTRSRSV
jgi:uncharacterized spore protein YtfJ